jgi:hypothetical protein
MGKSMRAKRLQKVLCKGWIINSGSASAKAGMNGGFDYACGRLVYYDEVTSDFGSSDSERIEYLKTITMEQHADLQRTVKTIGSNGLESFTTVHLQTLHYESHLMSTNCGPLGLKADVEPSTNRAALSDRSFAHVVHACEDNNEGEGDFDLETATFDIKVRINRLRVVSCLIAYVLVFFKHLPHLQPNVTYARELTNKFDQILLDEFNLPKPSRRKKIKRKMLFHLFAVESAVVEKFLWKHTAIDFKDMLPDENNMLKGFCVDMLVDVVRSTQRCLDHETILNAWSHNLDHSPPTSSHVFQLKTVMAQLHGCSLDFRTLVGQMHHQQQSQATHRNHQRQQGKSPQEETCGTGGTSTEPFGWQNGATVQHQVHAHAAAGPSEDGALRAGSNAASSTGLRATTMDVSDYHSEFIRVSEQMEQQFQINRKKNRQAMQYRDAFDPQYDPTAAMQGCVPIGNTPYQRNVPLCNNVTPMSFLQQGVPIRECSRLAEHLETRRQVRADYTLRLASKSKSANHHHTRGRGRFDATTDSTELDELAATLTDGYDAQNRPIHRMKSTGLTMPAYEAAAVMLPSIDEVLSSGIDSTFLTDILMGRSSSAFGRQSWFHLVGLTNNMNFRYDVHDTSCAAGSSSNLSSNLSSGGGTSSTATASASDDGGDAATAAMATACAAAACSAAASASLPSASSQSSASGNGGGGGTMRMQDPGEFDFNWAINKMFCGRNADASNSLSSSASANRRKSMWTNATRLIRKASKDGINSTFSLMDLNSTTFETQRDSLFLMAQSVPENKCRIPTFSQRQRAQVANAAMRAHGQRIRESQMPAEIHPIQMFHGDGETMLPEFEFGIDLPRPECSSIIGDSGYQKRLDHLVVNRAFPSVVTPVAFGNGVSVKESEATNGVFFNTWTAREQASLVVEASAYLSRIPGIAGGTYSKVPTTFRVATQRDFGGLHKRTTMDDDADRSSDAAESVTANDDSRDDGSEGRDGRNGRNGRNEGGAPSSSLSSVIDLDASAADAVPPPKKTKQGLQKRPLQCAEQKKRQKNKKKQDKKQKQPSSASFQKKTSKAVASASSQPPPSKPPPTQSSAAQTSVPDPDCEDMLVQQDDFPQIRNDDDVMLMMDDTTGPSSSATRSSNGAEERSTTTSEAPSSESSKPGEPVDIESEMVVDENQTVHSLPYEWSLLQMFLTFKMARTLHFDVQDHVDAMRSAYPEVFVEPRELTFLNLPQCVLRFPGLTENPNTELMQPLTVRLSLTQPKGRYHDLSASRRLSSNSQQKHQSASSAHRAASATMHSICMGRPVRHDDPKVLEFEASQRGIDSASSLKGNLFSRSAWRRFTITQLDKRGMLTPEEMDRIDDQGLNLRQRIAHDDAMTNGLCRRYLNTDQYLHCGTHEAKWRAEIETAKAAAAYSASVAAATATSSDDEFSYSDGEDEEEVLARTPGPINTKRRAEPEHDDLESCYVTQKRFKKPTIGCH